jgi:hypothetical protein
MKFKAITITTAIFFGISSFIFTSCQRERDYDISEGEETIFMERTNDDVFAILEQAASGDVSQFKKERGCATVTNNLVSVPKKLIVDFGVSNCLCNDGKTRRGVIIANYLGSFDQIGTVKTVEYKNYFVNDHQIMGSQTITNNDVNAKNNPTWTIDTKDTVVKPSNGGTATWQSMRTREMTNGATTPMWTDDKYTLSGSGSGVKANGSNWSMTLTEPIKIDHSCIYRMTSGAMQYQPQGKALRSLNIGEGACDNEATVTVNNKVINFKFK